MFGWIPLIGPIIQGIVSIFTKWQDTKLGTLKVERSSDIEEAQISAQIIHDTRDDIALRICRDMVCFPVCMWAMLMGWDTVIANHWPSLMWKVPDFPITVSYLPYMVLVFLFGNIGLNMWNRK